MSEPIEGHDSAARMVPKNATPEQIMWLRRARAVAKRSVMADLAAMCDAKARSIRAANPGRGKGTTSQIGEALAAVATAIADMIESERAKIGVPNADDHD